MSSKGRKSLPLAPPPPPPPTPLVVEGGPGAGRDGGAPLLRRAGTPPPRALPLPLPALQSPLPCLRSLILISSALPPPPPTFSPSSLGSDGENSRSDRTSQPRRRCRGSTVQAAACSRRSAAASSPRAETRGDGGGLLAQGGRGGRAEAVREGDEVRHFFSWFPFFFWCPYVVIERGGERESRGRSNALVFFSFSGASECLSSSFRGV